MTRSHGHANKFGFSPTYKSWKAMLYRVRTSKEKSKYYKDKGIKVCGSWCKFENFLEDMGERPEGMTIDRINNDGDYCPENCRWATMKTQSQNRGNNRLIFYKGETLCLLAWSRRVGIGWSTIRRRLELGWSTHLALTQPVRRKA